MRSREAIIVGIVVIVAIAILAVLYSYQIGQKTFINKSLTTTDGLKLTLHEATFRSIELSEKDIIIKATLENTTNKTIIPMDQSQLPYPSEPSLCNYYQTTSGCVKAQSPEYQQYLQERNVYEQKVKEFDSLRVKLLTPRNVTAINDFGRIGGNQNLVEILNSNYRQLNAGESIDGIMVFKINEEEKGTYTLTYQNQTVNFEVK